MQFSFRKVYDMENISIYFIFLAQDLIMRVIDLFDVFFQIIKQITETLKYFKIYFTHTQICSQEICLNCTDFN